MADKPHPSRNVEICVPYRQDRVELLPDKFSQVNTISPIFLQATVPGTSFSTTAIACWLPEWGNNLGWGVGYTVNEKIRANFWKAVAPSIFGGFSSSICQNLRGWKLYQPYFTTPLRIFNGLASRQHFVECTSVRTTNRHFSLYKGGGEIDYDFSMLSFWAFGSL